MIIVETSTVPHLECLMNSLQMRLYIVMRYRAAFRSVFFSSCRNLSMTVNEHFSRPPPSRRIHTGKHSFRRLCRSVHQTTSGIMRLVVTGTWARERRRNAKISRLLEHVLHWRRRIDCFPLRY